MVGPDILVQSKFLPVGLYPSLILDVAEGLLLDLGGNCIDAGLRPVHHPTPQFLAGHQVLAVEAEEVGQNGAVSAPKSGVQSLECINRSLNLLDEGSQLLWMGFEISIHILDSVLKTSHPIQQKGSMTLKEYRIHISK